MATAVTAGFVNLLEPILRSAIIFRFRQQEDQFRAICNVITSGKAKETDVTYADLTRLQLATEGQSVGLDNPVEGFKTEYTHRKFFGGFQVTEELMEDDLFNVIRRYPQALARSASTTLNVEAFAILNNAFTTLLSDGKALIATDHPLVNDSGANDNSAGAVDLVEAGLETIINKLEKNLSDSANFEPVKVQTLIVSTGDQFQAQRLLATLGRTGVDLNDINALRMKNLVWISSPYLTSPDAWFVRGADVETNMFIRRPLRIETSFDFGTGNMMTKATVRFSVGASDHRGWGGSTGT